MRAHISVGIAEEMFMRFINVAITLSSQVPEGFFKFCGPEIDRVSNKFDV